MLANIIHQKANDLAHNAPTCGVNEAGPVTSGARADYPLKREREKGVRSNCGAMPWANCAAISPKTEANLKPWPLSPVISRTLSCPGSVSMIKSSSGVLS